MQPNYYRSQSTQRDRWIISYADVLTILLILFVAISARNLETARLAAKVVAPPPVIPAPPSETPRPQPNPELLQAQQKLEQNGLDLRLEPEGLIISLPQSVLFSSGEDRVSSQAMPLLSSIAEVLRDIPNRINVLGHADAVPIHNRQFKSNWDLSMARSLRIMELLNKQYGISESRFSIASFGPYRPAGTNETADGRARNRRVEILIMAETASPNAEAGR
jgi:chemotaxis protein MotB